MKIASRLALFNALSVLAVWAAITLAFDSWSLQRAEPGSIGLLVAAALVVYWRVRSTYAAGAVPVSRAVTDGVVCGAIFAAVVQLLYWAFLVVGGYASLDTVTNGEGVVNLLNQAALSAATGAVIGAALWAANALALRRAVL
jgi:hypothetical protein